MGKRSDFERIPRDAYATPLEAVWPLIPHLLPGTHYVEPCCGDGALIGHLEGAGMVCVDAYDIEPRMEGAATADALQAKACYGDCFITNPPWDRKILHPLIERLSDRAPTWLLFDADWMHTRQAAPFLPRLRKVISIGRVKWIAGSKMTGKDNCCWYLFDTISFVRTRFFGRTA